VYRRHCVWHQQLQPNPGLLVGSVAPLSRRVPQHERFRAAPQTAKAGMCFRLASDG
jgi:hypothetical protein